MTHKNEVLSIYFFQLMFGLIIGGGSYFVIDMHLGKSIGLEHLSKGFDRTVIMDVLNSNKNIVPSILGWTLPFVPIYLLLSIILQGGFLYNIRAGETSVQSQIKNGKELFLPFLGIVLISIVSIIIVGGIITVPFFSLVGDPLTTFSSEKPYVLSIIGLILLFSIWIVIVWAWSIAARLAYISQGSYWEAVKKGVSFVRSNFVKIFAVGYLFLGVHVLLSFLYNIIMGDRGASSWSIVILLILGQQIFSFVRVYVRGMAYVAIEQIEDKII